MLHRSCRDRQPSGWPAAGHPHPGCACRDMYERFYDAFSAQGEASIPIDRVFMAAPGFYTLLDRLRRHADQHQRDHWCRDSLLHALLGVPMPKRAHLHA